MWPRLVSRGRGRPVESREEIFLASMWPRLISRGRNGGPQTRSDVGRASMWPRLISRGRRPTTRYGKIKIQRFNVAAADQPRKECSAALPRVSGSLASMWPRLISRGRRSL